MESVGALTAPEYTADDRQALIDFVLALRKSQIRGLLKSADLPVSGTKEELRARFLGATEDGGLALERLVEFLDDVAPWGKQHVFLFDGPRSDVQAWRNPDHVHGLLKKHRLGRLFNGRLPLVLPEKLTLSSVVHDDGRLRVTAIQRREYSERAREYDDEMESPEGQRITRQAYAHYVTRALVAFEWDMNANTATLQITQLQRDGDYDDVAGSFRDLVATWLDIGHFGALDLKPAIRELHRLEGIGKPEARSHGIQYRSMAGRRIAAHSPSPRDSVLGEDYIDNALESVRNKGVGHLGNFYWKPGNHAGPATNPLTVDVHVTIVGAKSRVNFHTPNDEDVVRYVLHRVRALSRTAS